MKTKQYIKNGYHLEKEVLSPSLISELKNYLGTLEPKLKLPFSNIPWGYGNLLGEGPFKQVTDHNFIKQFCKDVFKDEYVFNHLMVNNKASWIGSAVEWHQEIFNVDSYAPGYSSKDWKNFMQIYIALDEHTAENGCLRIIPRSDKLGVLSCEDIIGDNFGHKRRVTHKALEEAYNECGMEIILMNPGDILFFNHLTIHGSASNHSPTSRKSIVLQARCNIIEKNDDIFKTETDYRRNFTVNELEKKINKLKNQNPYTSFRKEKHGKV
jgi:ectoine hydroxylase-related dioxygenase (phytanoyl-CoA dioxygenase family)